MRTTISESRLNMIINESLDSAIEKLMDGKNDELTPDEKEELENEYFPKSASANLHNIKRRINIRRKNGWWATEDEDGNITSESPDYLAWKKKDDEIRRRVADFVFPNKYEHAACEGKVSDDKDELIYALEDDGFKEMKNGDWHSPDMYPGLNLRIVPKRGGLFKIVKVGKSHEISENTIRLAIAECVKRILQ